MVKATAPSDSTTTSLYQVAQKGFDGTTVQSDNYQGKITFDDGSVVSTYIIDQPSNTNFFKIVAEQKFMPLPLIIGTSGPEGGWSNEGVNYSVKDFKTTADGKTTGLQEMKFTMFNNSSFSLDKAYAVVNLPQAGVVDPNTPTGKVAEFTLKIGDGGTLDPAIDNNSVNDSYSVYYSDSLITVSQDGKTYTFEDGTSWTLGASVPAHLKTADQVTDWSNIKAVVMATPKLSSQNKITYNLNIYSPTSVDGANSGKKAAITEVMSYTGQTANLTETITDEYQTNATLRYHDQDGNEINGYAPVKGTATYNEETGVFEANNEALIGRAGDAVNTDALGDAPQIKGYVYVNDDVSNDGDFAADGSTTVTRNYVRDAAVVKLESAFNGEVLASATGDENPNKGSDFKDTPTGTDIITMKTPDGQSNFTDANLVRPGYKYTVEDFTTSERYPTLSEALDAVHSTFDDIADRNQYSLSQIFVVRYTPDFQQAVIISDNDPSKLIPSDTSEAIKTETVDYTKDGSDYGTGLYYSFGVSGGLMFRTSDGNSGLSADTYARPGYTYTLEAPGGKVYEVPHIPGINFGGVTLSPISMWMSDNPTFDDTDNSGKADSSIQVFKINYTAQPRAITYTVLDDTTGKTLTTGILSNGKYNDPILGSVTDKYNAIPETGGYLAKGYVYVGHDKLPDTYGLMDGSEDTSWTENRPHNVVIHLKHGVDTTVIKKVVTQTITYVDHDGNKVADPSKTDYTFTHTVETDKVTGKTITDTWTSSQTTNKVTSPTVDGYTPDRDVVGGFTVTHGTPDINETVTYTKEITDAQVPARVVVHYIDVNRVELPAGGYTAQDGKEIANTQQTLDGYVGDNYQNIMWDYASAGYELVSTLGNPTNGKFTAETGEAYVFLKHGTKEVTGTPISKTETIKYVNTDGDEVAETKEIVKTFTPVYTTDAVTGDILTTTWNGDGRTDAVVSPTIDGYTPDKFVVESMLLTPDGDDQLVVVTYTPDATPEVPATPTPAPEVPMPEPEAPATPAPAPKHEVEKPVAAKEAPALPQTGEDGNEATVLLGLGLVSAATLLGATELGRKRRKQN